MSTIKKRINAFDNLRFLLIFCVVLGHLLELTGATRYDSLKFSNVLYFLIYCMHMPAFLFLSGYFARFNWKKLLKLVILYVVFQTLYLLLYSVIWRTPIRLQYRTPYWLLWYLMTMIWFHVLLPVLDRIPRKLWLYAVLLFTLISLLSGYSPRIGYTFSLSRSIVFFPYFAAGYFFQKEKERSPCIGKSRKGMGVLLMLMALFGSFALYISGSVTCHMQYGSHPYSIGYGPAVRLALMISAALWIMGLLNLFLSFFNYRIPVVTIIGRNTLIIFLFHGIVVMAYRKYGQIGGVGACLLLSSVTLLVLGYLPGIASRQKYQKNKQM